jgi:predicted  nucleic acid-binding Zn-ribbon protein
MMNDTIRLLVALQDLDLMIKESQNEEESFGFRIQNLEKLQAAREHLAQQVSVKWLRMYERVSKRHGRAVVPVEGGVCLGCFMGLPTSHQTSQKADEEVSVCENCGRILYWL